MTTPADSPAGSSADTPSSHSNPTSPDDATDAVTAHLGANPAEMFTTVYDAEHTFAFIEDENCNITGYGHRDTDEFAAQVNAYDTVCNGEPFDVDEQWTGADISHAWVVADPAWEWFTRCEQSTPGAFPVTILWGQR